MKDDAEAAEKAFKECYEPCDDVTNPQIETNPIAKVIELMDDCTAKVKADAEAAEKALLHSAALGLLRQKTCWCVLPL